MNKSTQISRMALVAGGMMFGIWIGQSRFERSLNAEVRDAVPRVAFQNGAERSEVVLREIHATLKIMDGRLERLEKHQSRPVEKIVPPHGHE